MSHANSTAPWSHPLLIADLKGKRARDFSLTPDAGLRATIASELRITGLRKLRFDGTLTPAGKTDWRLSANLGATVVQNCVITLDPVTTRLNEVTERYYKHKLPEPDAGPAGEMEVPEDTTLEPLGEVIDLGAVMLEALTLALPQFPRAPGAELDRATFTEPGKSAMSDADARPFAQLKALRGRQKDDAD